MHENFFYLYLLKIIKILEMGNLKDPLIFVVEDNKVYNKLVVNYLEKKRIPLFNDLDAERDFEMQPGNNPTPEEYAEQQDMSERLHHAIALMPIQYRTIITLYHLQQMQYREIAEILNVSEGTIKVRIFRALNNLKKICAKMEN